MNKLITRVIGAALGLTMAIGVGVAVLCDSKVTPVYAADSTYTFTSASWADSTQSWTSDKAGGQLQSGRGVQVTANQSGAGAHTKSSISNITAIEFTYSTNASSGVGSISVTIGSNTVVTYSVTKTGGTSDRTTSKTYSTAQSGVVTFSVTCTTNSIYVKSIKITTSSGKTISSLTTDPDDGETVNLDANGANSVGTSVLYEVGYSDSSTGYDVTSSCSPSVGVTITDDENGELSLSFTSNGTFTLTVSADNSHTAEIIFEVTGIPVLEYELYTGTIVAGDYVIMSADANHTYVLGNTISNNRIANGATAPAVSNDTITNPSDDYVWHIAKDGNYWTIQNAANDKYLAGTTAKNTAALVTSIDDHARWTASYSSNWVFENLGRASDSDTPANKYLRNNTTSGWACYSSSQGNAPALFKLVSTDPAIEVAVTGSTSLAVGGTATLTASKVNGATGTVTWSKNNDHVTLSATTGDSITVTGATDGSTDVTASLTGGSTVDPVVTTFTVTKALSTIAVTTAPTKTIYTEGESFDNTGMIVTATYDDASTATPTDYTWSPSGALTPSDTTITISWGGKTTTQAITVNAKVVDHIKVKTLPTKNAYHSGDEFDPTGLVITVCYNAGETDTADITSGFTLSPASYTFTSTDETAGSKTFTVTYSGKEATFNVTVKGISGGLGNSGWFYITAADSSDSDVNYYFPQGQYSAGKAANNPGATAYDSSVYGKAYYFNLVADDTYTISWTDGVDTYYLNAIDNNSGAKVSTVSSVGSTCYWEYFFGEDDAYHLRSNDGTNDRYLAIYNNTDWRTYKQLETTNSNDNLVIISENDKFANDFKDTYTSVCNASGSYTTLDWTTATNAFNALHNGSEFTNAEYTKSGSGAQTVVTASGDTRQIVAEAVAKYDVIVTKYNTSLSETFEEFMGRVDANKISYSGRINELTILNEKNVSSIIVVVSMMGLTAVGGYFFLRKRKEQ